LIGKVSISKAVLPGKVSIATVEKEFLEGVPTGDIVNYPASISGGIEQLKKN